ncbi:hypothetical protein BDR07DRAFT_699898 [Suillus spraguei]|nr:hypothetical protein BDR07DRAFT_699898 [Suillus spraguei]
MSLELLNRLYFLRLLPLLTNFMGLCMLFCALHFSPAAQPPLLSMVSIILPSLLSPFGKLRVPLPHVICFDSSSDCSLFFLVGKLLFLGLRVWATHFLEENGRVAHWIPCPVLAAN